MFNEKVRGDAPLAQRPVEADHPLFQITHQLIFLVTTFSSFLLSQYQRFMKYQLPQTALYHP